eukprot:gene12999-8845_t
MVASFMAFVCVTCTVCLLNAVYMVFVFVVAGGFRVWVGLLLLTTFSGRSFVVLRRVHGMGWPMHAMFAGMLCFVVLLPQVRVLFNTTAAESNLLSLVLCIGVDKLLNLPDSLTVLSICFVCI